jgi:glycosyltransferase involved in cell wall biosynthesis
MQKNNLAIYAIHPIMYQTPIFRVLSEKCNEIKSIILFGDDLSLKKVYFKQINTFYKPDVPLLLDGYNYKFLKNWAINSKGGFFSRINFGIVNELYKNNYNVILIHGYESLTAWLALFAAKLTNTKIIWRGEAVLRKIEHDNSFKQILKRFILKRFFNYCDAVMYSCTGNKAYLKFYGVERDKLFSIPCAVNNNFFQEENKKYIVNITGLRSELGIHKEDLVVLFSARFTSRKRPMDLLKAINNIDNTNITILFVGDGPERENMEKYVEENKIKAIFTGFINQSQISKYYSIADINVVISDYDPSPKAMNEAMNFKLPIIVTEVVGTAHDLVKNNENGFIIKVGDIKSLFEKVSFLNQNRNITKSMGEKSFEIVQKWNYEEDVKGIMNAFEYVTK